MICLRSASGSEFKSTRVPLQQQRRDFLRIRDTVANHGLHAAGCFPCAQWFNFDEFAELARRFEHKAAVGTALLKVTIEIAHFAVFGRNKAVGGDKVARIGGAHVVPNDRHRVAHIRRALGAVKWPSSHE